MCDEVGNTAIQRAMASIKQGGRLDLGFFGGEPLLEAPAILRWMQFARDQGRAAGVGVEFHLTTNGTLASDAAWQLLTKTDLRIAVSFDGLPAVHDRFRIYADGRPSSGAVEQTIRRLVEMQKRFSVIMVVRPQTAAQVPEGIRYLRSLGVRSIEPSLDLWTHWTHEEARVLRRAIAEAADLWLEGLPLHALSWFDEKALQLARIPAACARCGFGDGELAIAPSGNLYPCERLIGEDAPAHPLRFAGHVLDGGRDFPPLSHAAGKQAEACTSCGMNGLCNTSCRCSNFVRTGDIRRPDGLLCMLNQACLEEVAARMQPVKPARSLPVIQTTVSI